MFFESAPGQFEFEQPLLVLVGRVVNMKKVSESFIRTIEITMPAQFGFHLRIVARFVKCVRRFRSAIRVRKGKITADGKNVLGLLLLAAAWKSKLSIEAEGEDADQAIASIKDFFQIEKT